MEKKSAGSNGPSSSSSKTGSGSKPSSAKSIHSRVKKSQTLVRKVTKRPSTMKSALPTRGRFMDIAKSPKITKFARSSTENKQQATEQKTMPHPIMQGINRAKALPTAARQSMKETKDQLIKEAVDKVPVQKKSQSSRTVKKMRRLTLATIAILVLSAAVYIMYSYVPAFSVRIAASQAGINATYPSFTPDNYNFTGPIKYENNKIYINYKENNGNSYYQITEEKSSWDSSAVKENIAKTWANHSPSSFEEQGQNVYYSVSSNETKAAWVNGGILYQLNSDTGLSYDNIRRIVKSM